VKITKEYDCPSPRIKTDTAETDSLMMPVDSANIQQEPEKQETPENKPPAK